MMTNLKKDQPTWTQLTLPLEYLPELTQNEVKPNQRKALRATKANITSVVIIENSCTTARAAKLLNISTTTLYRAKNEGKSYRCGLWTAIAIGPNC